MIPLLSITGGSLTARDRTPTPVALTGSGALRAVPFDGAMGWLVEEGTMNRVRNPVAHDNTNLWTYNATVSVASDPALPASLPGELASKVTTAFRVTATSTITGPLTLANEGESLALVPTTYSMFLYVPGSWTGGQLQVRSTIPITPVSVNMALRDQWQRVLVTSTPTSSPGAIQVQLDTGAFNSGEMFWFTAAQIEDKPYATTYTDGSFGTGYAWTGTAHASASTRAAASLSASGNLLSHVNPASGAAYIRAIWPDTEKYNQSSCIFLAGRYSDAMEDMVSLARLSNESIAVSLRTDGITVADKSTGTNSIASAVRYSMYIDWTPTLVRVTPQSASDIFSTSARSSPAHGLYINDVLNIGQIGNGSQPLNGIIGPILFFDRPLTDAERTKLDATPTAQLGWNTLLPTLGGIMRIGGPEPVGILRVGGGGMP